MTITIGSTAENFYQELETEVSSSSLTREEFWFDDEKDCIAREFKFQAIYNAASDVDIMQRFIERHTGKSPNQITNSEEIKRIFIDWLNGESIYEGKYTITKSRAMQLKKRYYRYICRAHKILLFGEYSSFSKWVKQKKKMERSRS